MEVFTKVYDNGLKLVIKKMDGFLSVAHGIMVGAGSRNETEQTNGISHFLEHMLFKGTNTRTALQVSADIERIGASINGATSKESTIYYTVSTYEHQQEAFEILSDIFLNSNFPEKEIEKERGVIIEEINMSEDDPADVCYELLCSAYHDGVDYGRSILGPLENIKRFTRDDLIEYRNKNYTPNNIVISVTGAVDVDKTVEFVDKHFGVLVGKFDGTVPAQNAPITKKSVAKSKEIEQVHIAVSLQGFEYGNADTDALSVATIVFGDGMSSRLFQKVREELGLCYSIYAMPTAYKDRGRIDIFAGVNPQKKDDAFNAIVAEIDKMKDGITEDEFVIGKEQLKSCFILSQENVGSQMRILARQFMDLNKTLDAKERVDAVNKLTIDDVNAVIKKVFNSENIVVATVGKGVEPFKI